MSCPSQQALLEDLAEGAPKYSAHLARCPSCQHQQLELEAVLASIRGAPEEFADPQLASDLVTMINRGADAPRALPGRRSGVWLGAMMAAAATIAAVVLTRPQAPPSPLEFQARGGAQASDRWVSIAAHRKVNQTYVPVRARVEADDALVFRYTNSGPAPYRYLMILAADSRGSIFWYYPAYTEAGSDPRSVEINASAAPVELREEIRHALSPGPLKLFSLFSNTPLSVRAVEAHLQKMLKTQPLERIQRLPINNTGQHTLELVVP